MKRFNIAICGMGRAGSIHLGNCYGNPRTNIKYIVELDTEKAEEKKQEFGLTDTVVLHTDDFEKVQSKLSHKI